MNIMNSELIENRDCSINHKVLNRFFNLKFKKDYTAIIQEKRSDNNDNFTNAIHFYITIGLNKNKPIHFNYSMGIGNFYKQSINQLSKYEQSSIRHAIKTNKLIGLKHDYSYHKDFKGKSLLNFLNRDNCDLKTYKIKPPKLADIFYGLVLDSEACEMSFQDWCDNFGLDSDSIKAKKSYDQCQEIGFKVKSLLGHRLFDKLKTYYLNF